MFEVLRQLLEDRVLTISRDTGAVTLLASCILINLGECPTARGVRLGRPAGTAEFDR